MKFFSRFGLGLAAVAFAASAMAQEYVAGEALVKFKGGNVSPSTLTSANATLKNVLSGLGWVVVKFAPGTSVEDGIATLKRSSAVLNAHPNYIYHSNIIPNDPRFGQMYGLPQMRAPQAWDKSLGSANVTVAVLDTGTQLDHEDLVAKIVPGFDFVTNDSDPSDESGHGTHVSGTVGASWNNGIGVCGVAPLAKIMPVRVLGPSGGAVEWIANGIKFAADNGAKIINMSLGGGGDAPVMRDAVVYALNKGTLSFAASGNAGSTTKSYPGAYPEVVCVGATNANDVRAGFSNFGADWVDIAAAGENVMSTTMGGGYGFNSGTSMACPNAAGAAALILGAMPNLTAQQLRNRIESTCDPVGDWVAFGRVNLDRAVPNSGPALAWAPTAASILEGSSTTGTFGAMATSNNIYYTVNSAPVQRLGTVASAKVTFRLTQSVNSITSPKVKFELSAVNNTTASIFAWNNSTGKYDLMGSLPMVGSDKVKEFNLPTSFSRYFNSNREFIALVRVVDPISMGRAPRAFTMRIDQGQITAFPR